MLKINLFWICPSINILIPFFITGKSIQKLFCYSETSAFAFQKINHDELGEVVLLILLY